jgi:glyoxylase-like metal-dependent hydrolase (beta-lactamase superfamily II)
MSRRHSVRDAMPWKIAPDVYCLGPSGWTQTNVYFVKAESSWTLIDAGWAGDGDWIERAARLLLGDTARPGAILLTHCHPDHSGAARYLAGLWSCPVYMHPSELPIANGDFAAMQASAGPLDRCVVLPFMRLVGTRRREAILAASRLGDVGRTIDPGAVVPSLPGWECIATPGHTPGHVAYFRRQDRVLVSGDALATFKINSVWGLLLARDGLSGPPWYTTWNRDAAGRSIRILADLNPYVLAGGHGRPLVGGQTAAVLRSFAAGV